MGGNSLTATFSKPNQPVLTSNQAENQVPSQDSNQIINQDSTLATALSSHISKKPTKRNENK